MNKIRKGDSVVLLTGRDKGKQGTVTAVLDNKLVIEGVNIYKKSVKPNPAAGITGGLMLIVFGILLTAHFRAGWLAKNNRLTGVLQLISLVILIVTGYLLYYGSGSIRDIVLTVHEVFGLLFVFFFGCHLAFRRNSRRTDQNMASISLRTR